MDTEQRIKEIESAMAQADFWLDKDHAQSLIKELHSLKTQGEGEEKYDAGGVILSIVAGAGGDDAEDFARILLSMYSKFAEKRGWSLRMLHANENDQGGYRNLSMEIDGTGVYKTLKEEYGVHRLVRISPFNASKKRQTSFVLVEVLPVLAHVSKLDIPEKDLDITFARSSGPGGQNVNKRETAARVVHIPTGISAHVDGERSQNANKEKAIAIVTAKLLRQMEVERKDTIGELSRAEKIEWGSQIRSYVLHPYKLVKDHRSGVEIRDVEGVLEGDIEPFLPKDEQ